MEELNKISKVSVLHICFPISRCHFPLRHTNGITKSTSISLFCGTHSVQIVKPTARTAPLILLNSSALSVLQLLNKCSREAWASTKINWVLKKPVLNPLNLRCSKLQVCWSTNDFTASQKCWIWVKHSSNMCRMKIGQPVSFYIPSSYVTMHFIILILIWRN